MFYTFNQNNSGGHFDRDDNICEYVIVEANNAEHANQRAQDIGVYFDGCSTGQDCSCCGDRWSEQWDDENGTEGPTIYGDSVYSISKGLFRQRCIIHRIDGSKEAVEFLDS